MQRCEVCSAKVTELRRNRCWGCYTRWVESRPVGLGAACSMCGDRRRDHLKSVELLGAWIPICHNCAARAGELSPMPQSLGEIRARLARDRRLRERRQGSEDTRVFPYDRRTGERRRVRSLGEDDCIVVDDEMIVEIEEIAESLAARDSGDRELTRIRENPLY